MLSLANNQIKAVGELGHLKSIAGLRHIALTGNPCEYSKGKDRATYEKCADWHLEGSNSWLISSCFLCVTQGNPAVLPGSRVD